MNSTANNPLWDMPRQHKCPQTIEEGKFFASKESPLIISDFNIQLGYLKFLETANAYPSDKIDILYTSGDIHNIDSLIRNKDYSDIFIALSSDDLVNNLRSEYAGSVNKITGKGVAPIWKIEQ